MGKGTQALHKLWRILGSTRLTAILLAVLLLASLLASLFPQMPPDPAASEPWLAAVRLRYRNITDLLYALGLFDAYHASWFLGLLAALLLNTLFCTVQRLPRLWRSLTQPPLVSRPAAFYQGFAHRAEWSLPSVEAGLPVAQQVLAGHRYRIYLQWDEAAGYASLYAELGRWAQAGTLVSHLAVLLLVIAVLARPTLGWSETGVILLPGQAYSPGREPALAMEVGQLTIERHPDGQPRNYWVPLTVEVDGATATSQTVGINHPLTLRGIAFHLQSYGPAAQVTTPDQTYNLPFIEGPAQEITLPEAGILLRVAHRPEATLTSDIKRDTLFVEAIGADGDLLGSGTVANGDEIVVQGMPITFSLSYYTIWQISHDPTFGLAVGAASLMLAGLLVSLWVPYRRLWLRIESTSARMVGTGEFDDGFEALANEVAMAITAEAFATCQPESQADGQ
jgi:cytochrome c biogenesis protein